MRAERGYGILSCSWAALRLSFAVLLVSVGFAPEHSAQAAGKTLSIIVDAESDRADEAEIIATYLRAVGVEAEVRIWEWNALKERLVAGERQMYLSDWGSAYFDPFDLVIPKLGTADRGNYSGYSNKELDELLTLVQMTAIRVSARKLTLRLRGSFSRTRPGFSDMRSRKTEAARGESQTGSRPWIPG